MFEEFVRNFYRLEARNCRVSREDIFWDITPLDEISASFLPKMTTDISIERNGSKVVIETKYYKEVLISHFGLEKYHSQHFYQLFSYLKNLEAKGGANLNCSGILLYPTVDKEIKALLGSASSTTGFPLKKLNLKISKNCGSAKYILSSMNLIF